MPGRGLRPEELALETVAFVRQGDDPITIVDAGVQVADQCEGLLGEHDAIATAFREVSAERWGFEMDKT